MSVLFGIRAAQLADVSRIVQLAESVAEAPRWNEAVYREFVAPPNGAALRKALVLAADEGYLYGFAAASTLEGEAELESIAVAEDARRLGIGSALLDAVIHWSVTQGAEVMLLEVRAASISAQSFYKANGFRQVGLRRGYYRSPDDDGVLMLREADRPIQAAGFVQG